MIAPVNGREMDPQKKQTDKTNEAPTEEIAWRPEVLDGAATSEELPADFDLAEVWYWFHSRLKAMGDLSHDDARLTARLNWSEVTVSDALRAARLHISKLDEEAAVRQAHLEYLTAEFLARQVLEEKSIPAPELRPA